MAEENKANPDLQEEIEEETVDAPEDIVEEAKEADDSVEDSDEEKIADQVSDEETDTQETCEAEAPEVKKEGKKLFGKKKDKKDEKIEELTDQLKRQMAEFDNFRKRTNQEKASMYVVGAKEIVETILPVVDSFERGLAAVEEAHQEDPFVDGMNKIYKQLMTALEGAGVAPIEAVGAEFNPDLHNAVMHVESEEVGDNIIVEEFQKGYLYKEFVVRHSMVKVAN
jgi:molecular chaperone GrpE